MILLAFFRRWKQKRLELTHKLAEFLSQKVGDVAEKIYGKTESFVFVYLWIMFCFFLGYSAILGLSALCIYIAWAGNPSPPLWLTNFCKGVFYFTLFIYSFLFFARAILLFFQLRNFANALGFVEEMKGDLKDETS